MNQKYQMLIKDTFIFAIGSVGSKCILFLLVPLYTNYLTTEEYGVADLVFTIAQFLIPFVSVVIFDAVVRFGLSKDEKPEDVLLIGCIIFIAGSCFTIITTPFIGLYHSISEWKWYLCAYVIFNMANSIELNYLKVKNNNRLYALVSILQTAILAGLNVLFLAVFRIGVKGYLVAYIMANVVALLVAFFCGNIGQDLKKGKYNPILMRQMVKYSSPLILNNVSWWIIHSSDKIMIESIIGVSVLGIYTVAAKIPSLINVIVSIFQQAWGISSVKEMESTNDTKYYTNVFKFYNLITCSICIFFVSVMKIFMNYYVGDGFHDAWRYVPLLLASAVFSAISSFYGSLYGALKKSVNNMFTTALAAVTNIVVNFTLIPVIGIWGAIIGTLISYITIAIVRIIDVERFIKVEIKWGKYILNYLIVIIQALFVSLDFHIYIVSSIVILLFAFFNRKELIEVIRIIKR